MGEHLRRRVGGGLVETIHPEAHAYDRMSPPEVFEKKSRRVKIGKEISTLNHLKKK
jgi:hypothetical protein